MKPEIPLDLDGVSALLELARAFMPNFEMPGLVSAPPRVPGETPEGRVRKAEARYQALVEQIPAVTFMASFENGLSEIYVSPHIETMLGYTAREWIDDPILWYQRLHPADKERWNQEFSRTVSWAEPFKADYRFLAKNGDVVWIHGEAKVVRDEAGIPSFVQGIGYDITELKRAEEVLLRSRQELEDLVEARTTELAGANESLKAEIAKRKLIEADLERARDAALVAARQKAEFLANMSHEIRTPMNGVIGMTELLLATPLNAQQRDFSETIRASSEALLGIINDILDFSKIEAGKLHFEQIDFDLRECVENTLELLATRAHAKGVELAFMFHPDVPNRVRGDPGRLGQVLINLVGNAIKFTEKGEVLVTVCKHEETATDAAITFEVKDTGVGISAEAVARLFQPFSQADGSTTRKYGGTGLGLAISKQLVALMHGRIEVESEPGQGSTFWFTVTFETQPREAESETAEPGLLAGLRVLVVDDNATNRKILHHQLGSWKIIDSAAAGGVEALQMLRDAAAREPFDLALLDVQMPEMDGFTLARAIKADPAIADTRLILLSSMGKNLDPGEMKAEGIAASLSKPLRRMRLYECLCAVVGAARGGAMAAGPAPILLPQRPQVHDARILLAEDNSINQKVAVGQLRMLGYNADAVANGAEVIEALGMITYEVIFMDCQMPEMDGYEATRRIREMEAKAQKPKPVYIIAMTANAMEGDRERCLAAGMDDYISKPVRSAELQAAMERWSHPARAERSARAGLAPRESAVLDAVTIAEIRKMPSSEGRSMLQDVIEMTLDDAPKRLAEIKTSAGDPAAFRAAVHLFKGICLNVGALLLAEVCREIEERSKAAPMADMEAAMARLEAAFAATRVEFLRLLEELQGNDQRENDQLPA